MELQKPKINQTYTISKINEYVEECNKKAIDYINAVKDGTIITNKYIKQAVALYETFLTRDDLYFNQTEVNNFFKFAFFIRSDHSDYGFVRFNLIPFQCFFVYAIFGIYRKVNNFRKHTEAFIFIARQNGKTSFAALVSLYLQGFDKELNPSCLYISTTTKQAKTALKFAKDMVANSPILHKYYYNMQYSIRYQREKNNGEIEIVANVPDRLDSRRPNLCVLDEIWSYPDNAAYTKIKSGQISRNQPLILMVSSAGKYKDSFCYERLQYSKKVLNNELFDDYIFPLLFTLDEGDDIHEKENWKKSNPSYGHSFRPEAIEKEYNQSKNIPSQWLEFVTLNLNIFPDEISEWIPTATLSKILKPVNINDYKVGTGTDIYIGIDLSGMRDITAMTVLIPLDGGTKFVTWTKFYLANNIESFTKRQAFNLRRMVDEGNIHLFESETMDFDSIKLDIIKLHKDFNIKMVSYDTYNSLLLWPFLQQEGIPNEIMNQQFRSTNQPLKMLEKYIIDKSITIDDNPCMRWNFGNVVIETDSFNNLRYSKDKAGDSIDGLVSLVMALYAYQLQFKNPQLIAYQNSIMNLTPLKN